MRTYRRLRVQLSKEDEKELHGLLQGGIQQVRVVLRALALLQLSAGQTAGRVAKNLMVHYTPRHGSWLNQAEIEISLFARQCLGRRRIPSLAVLERESRAWNRRANRDRVKINWQFTRKRARAKFRYDSNSFRRSET